MNKKLYPVPFGEDIIGIGNVERMLDYARQMWPDVNFSIELATDDTPYYINAEYETEEDLGYIVMNVENKWPESWGEVEVRLRNYR